MASIEVWLAKNLGWLGFVIMCILGSVVAHIKKYEASDVQWTPRQHFWGIVRRLFYGALAGIMVYMLHIEYQWSGPLTYVFTGIVAIFASEFFDLLFFLVKRKLGLNSNGGDHDHEIKP